MVFGDEKLWWPRRKWNQKTSYFFLSKKETTRKKKERCNENKCPGQRSQNRQTEWNRTKLNNTKRNRVKPDRVVDSLFHACFIIISFSPLDLYFVFHVYPSSSKSTFSLVDLFILSAFGLSLLCIFRLFSFLPPTRHFFDSLILSNLMSLEWSLCSCFIRDRLF